MANHVKICTIGAASPSPGKGMTPQQAVKGMIAFWTTKLATVLPDHPDLIVIPECSDRWAGMTWADLRRYYRARGTRLLDFWSDVARRNHCYIAYAAHRQATDGTWRNSIQLIDRSGSVAGVYDKNHPMIEEIEENGIVAGHKAPIYQCDFGRVACAICFDLNFDALRLNYVKAHPDLILFCSMYHGGLMQAYWAYSCRAHFVGAIGVAGVPSTLLSPSGRIIATTTNYVDHVTSTVNLDCRLVHLDYNQEGLAALKRRYGAGVTIADPGLLGSVLVSSEAAEVSCGDMLKEFGIEELDHYLARSLKVQKSAVNKGRAR